MIIKQDFRKMRTSYQVLYMVYWIFLLYMDRHSYTVIYLQTIFFRELITFYEMVKNKSFLYIYINGNQC